MKKIIFVLPFALLLSDVVTSYADFASSYNQGTQAGQQMGDSLYDAPLRRQLLRQQIKQQQIENEQQELRLQQAQERFKEDQERRESAAKSYEDFRSQNPCPSTEKTTGSCPGYSVNFIIPLENGGSVSAENMQWIKQ